MKLCTWRGGALRCVCSTKVGPPRQIRRRYVYFAPLCATTSSKARNHPSSFIPPPRLPIPSSVRRRCGNTRNFSLHLNSHQPLFLLLFSRQKKELKSFVWVVVVRTGVKYLGTVTEQMPRRIYIRWGKSVRSLFLFCHPLISSEIHIQINTPRRKTYQDGTRNTCEIGVVSQEGGQEIGHDVAWRHGLLDHIARWWPRPRIMEWILLSVTEASLCSRDGSVNGQILRLWIGLKDSFTSVWGGGNEAGIYEGTCYCVGGLLAWYSHAWWRGVKGFEPPGRMVGYSLCVITRGEGGVCFLFSLFSFVGLGFSSSHVLLRACVRVFRYYHVSIQSCQWCVNSRSPDIIRFQKLRVVVYNLYVPIDLYDDQVCSIGDFGLLFAMERAQR